MQHVQPTLAIVISANEIDKLINLRRGKPLLASKAYHASWHGDMPEWNDRKLGNVAEFIL